MKSFLRIVFLLVLFLSCDERERITHEIVYSEPEATRITDMEGFALALYKAVNENENVYNFIKSKAKDKIDYDYDVLYSSIYKQKINGLELDAYIFTEEIVKTLTNKRLNGDLLVERYPLLNLYFL